MQVLRSLQVEGISKKFGPISGWSLLQLLGILQYTCGLKFGPALNLNQNLFLDTLEMLQNEDNNVNRSIAGQFGKVPFVKAANCDTTETINSCGKYTLLLI